MTKEVKIGLLVGLAFIIVIGILLSDHIQSSTEPPQAKLADAGKTAQEAVNTLGAKTPAPAVVITPANVTPQQQVPTANDLNPRPQVPTQIVAIGPGASSQQPPISIVQDRVTPTPATNTPPQSTTTTPPAVAIAPHTAGADAPDVTPTPNGGLREVARQIGEELVPVGPGEVTSAKSYKAEPNDTLSRMASKFFGANTKANRELIIKANPSLRDNPDRVIVGRTYVIPATAEAPAAAVASSTQLPSAPAPTDATVGPQNPAGVEHWYTVKPNDSLWRIATEQCGNPGAVAAIKELNKDALKGTDIVKVDMKLRLPAQSVASVN